MFYSLHNSYEYTNVKQFLKILHKYLRISEQAKKQIILAYFLIRTCNDFYVLSQNYLRYDLSSFVVFFLIIIALGLHHLHLENEYVIE